MTTDEKATNHPSWYTPVYHPTSGSEWNLLVILGIACQVVSTEVTFYNFGSRYETSMGLLTVLNMDWSSSIRKPISDTLPTTSASFSPVIYSGSLAALSSTASLFADEGGFDVAAITSSAVEHLWGSDDPIGGFENLYKLSRTTKARYGHSSTDTRKQIVGAWRIGEGSVG